MGIYGAGLATAIGSAISFVVMLTHFFSRKNTLRLVKVEQGLRKFQEISVTGFSTFFIDVAMGILTVLFNRQIMKYLGTDALAIYGPIIQVSTFVQCCAYSVGQAAQPIISTNFGAGKGDRILETLRLALGTAIFFGLFWTVVSMACPNLYSASSCSPPSGFWKSPRHHPPVRHLLPLPAPEHLLHLLFPGHHEAQGGVRGLGGPRMRHQRHFDSAPARPDRSGFHLAGHAYHRAGDPALCAHHDETDDQGTDTVRIQG